MKRSILEAQLAVFHIFSPHHDGLKVENLQWPLLGKVGTQSYAPSASRTNNESMRMKKQHGVLLQCSGTTIGNWIVDDFCGDSPKKTSPVGRRTRRSPEGEVTKNDHASNWSRKILLDQSGFLIETSQYNQFRITMKNHHGQEHTYIAIIRTIKKIINHLRTII